MPSTRDKRQHAAIVATNGHLRRERVTDIQRARMLAAMTEVASEHGAANVTVANVVERAGVSRRTFYEIFEDTEDCLLAAIDVALSVACGRVLPAYRSARGWREQIRAGLTALLQFLEDEPHAGRLLVVEALGGPRRALERRSQVVAELVTAVDAGRGHGKAGMGPSTRLTAEGVVGAVLSVIHGRMLETEHAAFTEFAGPLMSMAVLPYLGAAAARRELEREVIRPSTERTASGAANPLKELHMRLTYRTIRVLGAVASNPGASNRAIADAAGVGDQGQISKLLARMERLGLIRKAGSHPMRGEPNAWMLTARGGAVAALAEQSPSA
jgi:AcrR family transcriptional regulator